MTDKQEPHKYNVNESNDKGLYNNKDITFSEGVRITLHDRNSRLFIISVIGLAIAAIWFVNVQTAADDLKRMEDRQFIANEIKSLQPTNQTIILNPDGGYILIPNGTGIITGNITGKISSYDGIPPQFINLFDVINDT
jgi:hypothetical protein